MWEDLKIYKQLDKNEINSIFKKFGKLILSHLDNYAIEQTNSIIKLYRTTNQLEQAIFIEKSSGSYDLKVRVCIKPLDFYKLHKFTMLNIVTLGDIMNNHRRTSYPLTQEWTDLSLYLATRIKNEIEDYFNKYDSYEKIINKRKEIEPKDFGLDNKYELLIYAAIKTKNKSLLNLYLDKKLSRPVMQITKSEFLKPANQEINETEFLQHIKVLAQTDQFERIEKEIETVSGKD